MAQVKIKGIKEPFIVDNTRGRAIKTLRFGDINGHGKADRGDDLNIGEKWSGTVGQVEWVEIDPLRIEKPAEPEPTPEERKRAIAKMKEVGRDLRAKKII